MKKLLLSLTIFLCCNYFFTNHAFAIFDIQILHGSKFHLGKNILGEISGSAWDMTTFAAHLSPIPLVPLSIGGSFSQVSRRKKDLPTGYSDFSGSELGLEAMVWLPFVPFITPYLKLYAPLSGQYKASFTSSGESEVEANYGQGGVVNLGLRYSILPLIRLLIEGGKGVQMVNYSKCTLAGAACPAGVSNKKAESVDKVMIGLELNI